MERMSSDVIPSGGLLIYFLRSSSISDFMLQSSFIEDYITKKADQVEERIPRDLDIAFSYSSSRETR